MTEREKQSQACALPSAGCCGLHISVQPHTEHPPPAALDTNISTTLQKEGFLVLTPIGGDAARAAGRRSQVCSWHSGRPRGSHRPTHHHPVPPALQPWLFTTITGVSERGWWSDLDSAQSDLTPPQHLQSLSSKAEVTEETQGIVGYFWSQVARRFAGGKSKTVWHTSRLNFYALPVVTSPTRHGRCFLWRV